MYQATQSHCHAAKRQTYRSPCTLFEAGVGHFANHFSHNLRIGLLLCLHHDSLALLGGELVDGIHGNADL